METFARADRRLGSSEIPRVSRRETLTTPQPIRDAIRFSIDAPRLILGASIVLFSFDAFMCAVNRVEHGSIAVIAAAMLLRVVLRGWLRSGYLGVLHEVQRGEGPSVDTLTSGLDRIGGMVIASFVGDAVTVLSLVVGALPGLALLSYATEHDFQGSYYAGISLTFVGSMITYLYAWLGVRFAEHVVAIEGRGPFEALGRAWRIAHGRRFEIASVVFFSSGIELASVVWGLVSFGVGVFMTVPVARMAGDHALVARFIESSSDYDTRQKRAISSEKREIRVWRPGFVGARGAALPEYALLLVAILLAAASAYRRLGAQISASADSTGNAIVASGSGDGVGGAAGSALAGAAAGESSGGFKSFLSNAVKGAVLGDFAEGSSGGKLVGQTLVSLIPVVSQIAAARDIAHAIVDIAHGKAGGYGELLGAAAGAVPGFGPELKAGVKALQAGEKVAVAEGAAALAAAAERKVAQSAEEAAVNNPVSKRFARVIDGDVDPTHIGNPKNPDVFVGDAKDLEGLTSPQQIADKLAIDPPKSGKYTVIEFDAPAEYGTTTATNEHGVVEYSGVFSPVNREADYPKFVGKGQTGGGAPEYGIPNGPVPPNASRRVVQ